MPFLSEGFWLGSLPTQSKKRHSKRPNWNRMGGPSRNLIWNRNAKPYFFASLLVTHNQTNTGQKPWGQSEETAKLCCPRHFAELACVFARLCAVQAERNESAQPTKDPGKILNQFDGLTNQFLEHPSRDLHQSTCVCIKVNVCVCVRALCCCFHQGDFCTCAQLM